MKSERPTESVARIASMNASNDTPRHDPTRKRLLQAALEIFADKGFRDATVREICARAEVNVASVNYHFGSKEALYSEVLGFAYREASERYPYTKAGDKSLPPEVRLRHFIGNLLGRMLDDTYLGRHGKLLARELADPTPTGALDQVIETTMKPHCELLDGIVAELVGPGYSEADMHRLGLSVVGQCLMYYHSRSLIDRVYPEIIATPEDIERTAEHIARFSIAALKHLHLEKPAPHRAG
ncbi:TetR/AcrR family transcriptional regulator, regulator of cefoperazone and chloramphenicol sensitivity [Methylococcus capsulatus]|uniref:TetR/AcrR family transcriptional regulator, regulator of cefoperazone and chloramphenicol sensitivity n=2 Tax=Methylococcus capsulatus TaxID=414 RepID=A0AA35Y235_METCP|nr:TetR/AcrR family transcriptional regulator, regulator of cefoperazone and chloramphenicol sensitivity [Methylococcus capsulatus]